jgi:hypothetical protein
MKKLLLILLCLPFIGFGQTWENTYGVNAGGISVQQTTDGGYIICGGIEVNGNLDVYLLKTDGNGIEQWTKTYGDTSQEIGYSVQQTTDGGYIICGYTDSHPDSSGNPMRDMYVIKTDGSGNSQWIKTFGGNEFDGGRKVQQTNDGGYILCGNTNSYGNGNGPILVKIDGNGVEQWHQTFGVGNIISMHQTTDGGYILSGQTGVVPINYVYLIKTDSNGILQWTRDLGVGEAEARGNSVQQTSDGGYIITGFGGEHGYLIKTDGIGNPQWINTPSDIKGYSVQQTIDGGYIMTGRIKINVDDDVYLLKTDGNGQEEWSKTFGGINYDVGHSVQQTTDGGYIIAGATASFASGVYLIKTDGSGNITSTFNIPTPNSNRKLEKVVDILGKETKQTNQPLFYIYDDGTVEKRIVIE